MDTIDAIKTRHSVRIYKNKPVPKDLLKEIVESGIRAPSSMNKQPWRFIVVTKKDVIRTLSDEAKFELLKFLRTEEACEKYGDAVERFTKRAESPDYMIFYHAPAVILVIQTQETANGQFDHGLAAQSILLAAHNLELGAVPVGLSIPLNTSFLARKLLNLKKEEKIVISFPVGYPDEQPSGTERNFDVIDWIE
jgi:nitroreductase